jgi:hypothetical protein
VLTHNRLSCAREGCYAVITLHPDDEQRLRQTHETFYCPAGHRNYFPGKTDQEKRIEQLERTLASIREDRAEWIHELGTEQDRVRFLVRGSQVCPLGCGWHSTRRLPWTATPRELGRFLERAGNDLADHLVREHNATRAPVALLKAGGQA